MSRFHKYTRSLMSGYLLLAANVVYTLVSVPLGLHYLTTEEFGLWAVMAQVGGYVALIDAGMTTAVARVLVDHKDETRGDEYGSVIKTSFLVAAMQGLLVLGLIPALMWLAGVMPGVPATLSHQFGWLLAGQCGLLALTFWGRTFGNLLWAHQRSDVGNHILSSFFAVSLGLQWLFLTRGAGVYAIVWAQGLATLASMLAGGWMCVRLKLLPAGDRWGRVKRRHFRELFAFGKDVFISTVGSQMVNASQVIVVTICQGLEAGAIWSVCLRGYNLVAQIIWRVGDYSINPLSEMLVRGELEKFASTFRRVAILTATMAVAGAAVLTVVNQPFVHVWTHGRVSWARWNDALLAFWMILIAVQRYHCSLLNVRKDMAGLKYAYCAEGLLFLALGFAFGGEGGFAAILGSSIVSTLAITLRYGLHRTRRDFQLSQPELWSWWSPAVKSFALLLPLSGLAIWVEAFIPAWTAVVLGGGAVGAAGLWATFRWGMDAETRLKLREKLPRGLAGCLAKSCSTGE